jgi:hypothetical protein
MSLILYLSAMQTLPQNLSSNLAQALPQALPRTTTTEMEVTSIRLERTLKEKLKDLSGNRGYQALIRDILWDYVQVKSNDLPLQLTPEQIRATFLATAQQAETCALTGQVIPPQSEMWLGLTTSGQLVPILTGAITI